MSQILGPELSYAYWGRGSSFKGGDPSSDEHQAFNPMLSFPIADGGFYVQEFQATFQAMFPNIQWDKERKEGTLSLEMYFRDPFLLLTLFTYKTITASWTGTGDAITGAFTNNDDRDLDIWVQMHLHDHSGNNKHIEFLFDGAEVVKYEWDFGNQKPLIERVDLSFVELDVNDQPVDIDNGFDDASFNETGAVEVSTVVAKAAASIADGKYFIMEVIAATRVVTPYYVWFDKQGAEQADPTPTGYTKITVDISGDTSAQDVSDAITAAIGAKDDVGAANGGGASETITITNTSQGNVIDIVDVDSGLTVAVTSQGILDQDGGWSVWDGAYDATKGEVAHSKDVTITFGSSQLSGIDVQSGKLVIEVPKERTWVMTSLTANRSIMKVRNWYLELDGITINNDQVADFLAQIGSKSTGTVKVEYGTTKFLQFTNGMIVGTPPGEIPSAGEKVPGKYKIQGSANSELTFGWTADETTDPTAQVNATGV